MLNLIDSPSGGGSGVPNDGSVTDAKVAANAAIALTKLAAQTVDRVMVTDHTTGEPTVSPAITASMALQSSTTGIPQASGVSAATLAFLDATSSVQTQLNAITTTIANYLYVREEQAQNTAGGTFTAGAWQTRTLNTTVNNGIVGASLASNKVTLPAGTYRFSGRSPVYACDRSQSRLFNVTDNAVISKGSTVFTSHGAGATGIDSFLNGQFVIAGTKDIRMEHSCQTTEATDGFGPASNQGGVEVYSELQIWKVA